eukprot:CCRYP_014864-RA/>CCRYP_014864-RA protein AED:0.02 eAED:0.02 QI:171/1/1/1/1/1/2/249/533
MVSLNLPSLLALTSATISLNVVAASIHSRSTKSISSRRSSLSFLPTNFYTRGSFRELRSSRSIYIPTRQFTSHATTNDDNNDTTNDGTTSTTTTKTSQQELLQTLDSKFDYQGRISSKLTTTSTNNTGTTTSIPHRCALLTILGRPNMGKSTLLNALLSDQLAITTNRPQTTRHAILGVLTYDYGQVCLTDTPGIIERTAYRLQEGMMEVVRGAVRDGDVFLVVTDVVSGGKNVGSGGGGGGGRLADARKEEEEEEMEEDPYLGLGEDIVTKLKKYQKPILVCVNKVDLVSDHDNDSSSIYTNTPLEAVQTIQKWRALLPEVFAILPTCAANGPNDAGVVALRSILLANDPNVDVSGAIRALGRPVPGMFCGDRTMIGNDEAREILPIGPPLYGPDFFTDRTDRFCASELIRETLFERLGKELPYCCEVRVESFDESKRYLDEEDGEGGGGSDEKRQRSKSMIRIGAVILVERDSQKGIVVGKGGKQIKEVGMDARKKLQKFFGVKIFLDLRVKVDKNWRNNAEKLKQYGYMS